MEQRTTTEVVVDAALTAEVLTAAAGEAAYGEAVEQVPAAMQAVAGAATTGFKIQQQ